MTSRVVALIDMDCFYCQVETRLQPELIGTPVAVVQYKTWKGGGIIAVNYEARAAGVTRFMRGDEAKAQCPSITLCSVPEVRGKAGLTRYRDAGREVIQVFSEFSRCVERASVDEAFIDLTEVVEKRLDKQVTSDQLPNTFVVGFSPSDANDYEDGRKGVTEWLDSLYDSELDDINTKKLAVGAAVVEEIRAAVYAKTGFRCSAGIAHNKIIAKLAAGLHKPNRQTVLPQSGVPILFRDLPVKKVRNLGGKLGVAVVEHFGCQTMADLAPFTLKDLQNHFDEKTGTWLYNIARGIDHDQVAARLIPKSIGCSKRFPGNSALATLDDVTHWLNELSSEVSERLKDDLILNNRSGKVLTVMGAYTVEKKYNSFTRSGPLHSYDEDKITETAYNLIKKSNTASALSGAWAPPLINLGLSIGKFIDTPPGFNKIKQFFSAPASSSKDLSEQTNETALEFIPDEKSSNKKDECTGIEQFFSAASTSKIPSEEKKSEKNPEVDQENTTNNFESVKSEQNPNISDQNPDQKQPKSFLEKYFKRKKKKAIDNQTNESSINNEGSDTSNDHLQNCDSNEAKSILISSSNKPRVSEITFRNTSSFLKMEKDKPSTSFFQPDCNSTALESDTKVNSFSDGSSDPSYETDESSDCWRTINEIFPDLDNIDPEVVQLLPKKLQDVLYNSNRVKKGAKVEKPQAEVKNFTKVSFKSKVGRGRPTKKEKSLGDTTLSQFFQKSSESSMTVRVSESSTNRTLSQYFSKVDAESDNSNDANEPKNVKIVKEMITQGTSVIETDSSVEVKRSRVEKIDCDEEEESADTLISSCDIFEESDNETNRMEIEDADLEEIPAGVCHQPSSPPLTFNRTTPNRMEYVMNESCIDIFQETLPGGRTETDLENDADIINKLTPVVLSDQTVDLSTRKCSLCNESIIVAAMPEHMDYHAAVSLHKELNSTPMVNIPATSNKPASSSNSKVSKSTGNKSSANSNNSSLKRKKNQNGKSPKKSMNIASFFSTR